MFARLRPNKGTKSTSVLVCHSVRINGHVKQIIAKVIGHSVEPRILDELMNEAREWIKNNKEVWLKEIFPAKKQAMINKQHVSLFNLKEKSRINVGIADVFGKIYKDLSFETLLSASHQETLKKVLFARILEPGSKRRLSEVIDKKFNEDISLDKIYRMMDALLESSEEVQQKIFLGTQKALEDKISLVLFDVTTLSFESISEDELRAFGYSKDFKFNTTQVTLALATTKEGLPIGYRLFPGNTAESKTLIEAIESWKKIIPIGEVTIIGDRAMMSDKNLSELEKSGFKYVVACPLKKLSKTNKNQILDFVGYKDVALDNEISRFKVIDLGERRLLVSYSPKRAAKDAKDRERLVAKLKKKISTCKDVKRLINKNGYLKYTQVSGQAVASIDEEKILNDARWDGLHGVITNQSTCDMSLYEQYRRLWVIEESFRINKHNLKMQPIYHFTPRRIHAHIMICYMVFAMIRHLQYMLQKSNNAMSVNRIIDSVRDVQASILVDTRNDKMYKILSKLDDDAQIIYNILNLEHNSSIIHMNSV